MRSFRASCPDPNIQKGGLTMIDFVLVVLVVAVIGFAIKAMRRESKRK